jgi:predicted ATPase
MIHRVRIQNFKSLRDVTVELSPVTVLIGRSGTGKSNFVQALRFLRDYLTGDEQHAMKDLGGWSYVLCATRPETAKLAFDVVFDVPGIDGQFTYSIAFQAHKNTANLHSERLALNGSELFGQAGGQWTRAPDLVDPPPPNQRNLGRLYGIPEVRMAHIVLTKGLGCYDFPGAVLTGGAVTPKTNGLADDAVNYLEVYDGIATHLSEYVLIREMTAALRRLNSSVTSIDLATDRQRLRIGHRVGDAKVLDFALEQESEGFRRFLAHLLALYQQPAKQTVVFEEPEKGIYPGALAVLADTFQSVADSGRSQVILTPHSPQLLKHFKHDQIRVVELDGYDTKIGPLAPEQREALEEQLLTADELLTVDEARLERSDAQ